MTKSIVIYYSQTGNTKKIAQSIHKGIKQVEEHCDIARLREVSPQDLADYDLIGLGSPVIHQREYPNVSRFINSLKSVDGKHGFTFCTSGVLPGYYLARVVPAMTQRGLTVIGWNNWFANCYAPFVPKPYLAYGHPDEIDLEEAVLFGRKMAENSRRISLGETELIPVLPTGKDYDEIYTPVSISDEFKEFKKMYQRAQYKIDVEKCIYPKCTHCIDNCPTNAIDFSVSPPLFDRECDTCFLCEQTCPQGAIEFDFEPIEKFQKPFKNLLLKKSSEVFEAKGLFRRLLPLEKVGWDTNFWTLKKPPRFKIDD